MNSKSAPEDRRTQIDGLKPVTTFIDEIPVPLPPLPETAEKFARTGDRREFGTGAHRDANKDKGRFDLLPWDAIEKVARHFQKGAATHGERNWEKGIPMNVLLDSAVRHLAKELDGRADEDHLTAAAWNILCAVAIRLRCERGALPEELDNT